MPLPLTIRRISEPARETSRSLRGTFKGYVVPCELPLKAVQQLIPLKSGITPLESSNKDAIQVLFLFGKQCRVRNVWGAWEFQYGFGVEYDEVLMVVPDMKLPESTDIPAPPRVTLYARIFLSSLCSSVLGRFMYGFSKHYGYFESKPGRFRTCNRHGDQIFEAEITPNSGAVSAESIEAIRTLLESPVVFAGRYKKSSGCSLSVRQFHYEVTSDSLQPVDALISVDEKFTKKFPSQSFQTVGLDRDPNGSFQCEFPWIMTEYLPAT